MTGKSLKNHKHMAWEVFKLDFRLWCARCNCKSCKTHHFTNRSYACGSPLLSKFCWSLHNNILPICGVMAWGWYLTHLTNVIPHFSTLTHKYWIISPSSVISNSPLLCSIQLSLNIASIVLYSIKAFTNYVYTDRVHLAKIFFVY